MKYEVLVKHATNRYHNFEVEAADKDDARDIADDLAMDFQWGDLEAEEDWMVLDVEGERQMKFKICVSREATQHEDMTITADSLEEAEDLAIKYAPNVPWHALPADVDYVCIAHEELSDDS